MNRIVRSNYPASKLPSDLREGVDPSAMVTIVVSVDDPPGTIMSLEEIFAARHPPYRSREEIDADIRRQRDDWDD
jgi:hypothetical protein